MKRNKNVQLRTRRLRLMPVTLQELERKTVTTMDEDERGAYLEMYEACLHNPDSYVWYAPWKILLRGNGTEIGDICFKGGPQTGAVEIGYGLQEPYWGKGYMTEATRAVVRWAFFQRGVRYIDAETLADNDASQNVLRKLGFRRWGIGVEGPRFRLTKPSPSSYYLPIGVGVAAGSAMGLRAKNPVLGVAFGTAVAAGMGVLVARAAQAGRKKVFRRKI